MSIIAATLLTDRKPVFPVALEYLVNEPLVEAIYVNVERSEDPPSPIFYAVECEVLQYLNKSGKPYSIDYWQVYSNWRNHPKFDQDPARFAPIAMGRNMALDWAISQTMLNQSVSHLLFVDSDVRPHPGGLQLLLDLNKPITGGYVPGRGAHSGARYAFGIRDQQGTILRCDHGTSGYLLLQRTIFEVERFRAGPCVYKREVILCDDPAYATDCFQQGLADAWYIDTRATADHVDDPAHPLTLEGAINNYQVGGSSA